MAFLIVLLLHLFVVGKMPVELLSFHVFVVKTCVDLYLRTSCEIDVMSGNCWLNEGFYKCLLVWFSLVLLHINHCRLMPNPFLYIYIKYMIPKHILSITFFCTQLNGCELQH